MILLNNRDRPSSAATWAWKRLLRFVVVFVCIAAFAAFMWPTIEPQSPPMNQASNITISTDVKCELDENLLLRLEVKKLADYTRREIVVDFTDEEEVPITQKIDQPLWDTSKLKGFDHTSMEQPQDGCSIPHPVSVKLPPKPKLADASHIDFGVATTVDRLNDSLNAFEHWAAYTRTRIFALIEPSDRIPQVKAKADAMGINLSVHVSEDDYLRRYFALIPLLEENMRPGTKWGCIIDDDTFFPSMPALVEALSAYDHTQPMYIGGISEGVPQIGVFGVMAFGGAGVFLSRPLLSDLVTVYDECQQMDFSGDRRIAYCIYQYTQTRLTIDHRLRQLDLMVDASGFFESGRDTPLSVHHWKSWFHADMTKLGVISSLCGDSCLLRQWHFSDGFILTNGYSVIRYSQPLEPGDLSMEMTWDGHNGAGLDMYLHELGPLRPRDDDKISYLLQDSEVDEITGRVTQWYILRDTRRGDKVLELNWQKR
ncbi:hypothetical protein N7474_001340 [Penicillium riverlandense]|uniref:uncharacterized protein n=1 Tax=Penicillium riverlandense TaxID=1903569 RepID=UPI002548D5FF|nr:uncharacterized protein N7474_001340 [Penicillium riverlandense]KAJ5833029.1 hypothetical protein N7474_001340 [Penicillium riverlandense]